MARSCTPLSATALPAAQRKPALLAQKLLSWFYRSMRPLPWRAHYDPYAVWVSEMMLQQTQMDRAVPFFERWMRRFPTLAHVAAAHGDEVLKAWEGLGYYSRARNLHATAQIVMERHGGVFPSDVKAILALPGIGPYTAGAIASIAFNLPEAAVDANVERLFARLFDVDEPVKTPATADFIRNMVLSMMPKGKARDFNQALMEFGALVCGKKARCGECPLTGECRSLHLGIVAERPVPGKAATYTPLQVVTGILVHKGKMFVQKRLDSGVWAGFWEFPGGRLETGETPEDGAVREFFEETELRVAVSETLEEVRHAYTRYKITLHGFICELAEPPQTFPEPTLHAATKYLWAAPAELDSLVFPAGHRKLMEASAESIARAIARSQKG